jgi:UDP-3-O-[3-hydroxymyristoyl] glucosamine N-acyltransferase
VKLKSSIPIGAKVEIGHDGFTLGVKANVKLKSSIPIGAKVEIGHDGFTLGVKANVKLKSNQAFLLVQKLKSVTTDLH